MSKRNVSIHISQLLRHTPEGLDMDVHGWVSVSRLIEKINSEGKDVLTREMLDEIVASDSKGRYRFSEDGMRIKACQGHSIEWVIPELEYRQPPERLYHGTTVEAWEKIRESGGISRMSRHAVHMHSDSGMGWQSARRRRVPATLLEIDAQRMYDDGIAFAVSENSIWFCDYVPLEYIVKAWPDV